MTDPNDDRLPSLGERTPSRPRRSHGDTPVYKRPSVSGLAGIAVGLLLGLALAALAGDEGEQVAVDLDEPIETTVPQRTTTTVATLPRECADAVRTAEQSLTLLDQALQSARRFDVGDIDRMLVELQQVRRALTERVRACVDKA